MAKQSIGSAAAAGADSDTLAIRLELAGFSGMCWLAKDAPELYSKSATVSVGALRGSYLNYSSDLGILLPKALYS